MIWRGRDWLRHIRGHLKEVFGLNFKKKIKLKNILTKFFSHALMVATTSVFENPVVSMS